MVSLNRYSTAAHARQSATSGSQSRTVDAAPLDSSFHLAAVTLAGLMLMGAAFSPSVRAGEAPSSAVATPVSATPTATGSPDAAAAEASPASASTAVVRQVDAPSAPAAGVSTATPASATGPVGPSPQNSTPSPAGIGDTTRGLLNAQADGRRAAPALPMLGSVASASYQRYIDSFKQPIPIFFGTTVDTDSGQ